MLKHPNLGDGNFLISSKKLSCINFMYPLVIILNFIITELDPFWGCRRVPVFSNIKEVLYQEHKKILEVISQSICVRLFVFQLSSLV